MIISATESQNYDRCQRLWALTSFNGQSLTRIVNSPALNLGTLWHQTQAAWTQLPDEDPVDLCTVYFVKMLEEAKLNYRARHGHSPMTQELQPIEEVGTLCQAMVKNYQKKYGKPIPDGFRIIMPEQTLLVPIPDSEQMCFDCRGSGYSVTSGPSGIPCEYCKGTGKIQHQLEATLDGVLANDRNTLFVLERKTYGNRPKINALENNYQFIVYQWAIKQLGLGNVGGLLYDGAWKRAEPPKGRTFDELFLRVPIEANEHRLEEMGQLLAYKARQMYTTLKQGNPLLNYNRRWEGCYDCGPSDICEAMSNGEDVQYVKDRFYTLRAKTAAYALDDE